MTRAFYFFIFDGLNCFIRSRCGVKNSLFFIFAFLPVFSAQGVGQESPSSLQKKYQVCSITINSSNEIETFKRNLPSKDFEFVELIPDSSDCESTEGNSNSCKENKHNWFESACEKDIQCDVLVISGHFGGSFFGESGHHLNLSDLEELSCKRECENILSRVQEVFLFGCNTLAGKEEDSRSPEEYLQVLLDDNIPRDQAEMVVATRYSFLNNSFNNKMRLVFSSSERSTNLYGFHSISPSGQNVQHMLENYFEKIRLEKGSYAQHLSSLRESPPFNKTWEQSLSVTNQSQSLSFTSKDREYDVYEKACGFYNNDNHKENLELADEFLREEEGLAYFPYISDFLRKNRDSFHGEALSLFKGLQRDEVLSKHFNSLYQDMNSIFEDIPIVHANYLRFLLTMDWIGPENYKAELDHLIGALIIQPSRENLDTLKSLYYEDLSENRINIRAKDLPDDYFSNIWGLKTLAFFKPKDKEIHNKIAESLFSSDVNIRREALVTLAEIAKYHHLDYVIHHAIARRLEDAKEVRIAALWALREIRPSDPVIHRAIGERLRDRVPEVRVAALWALAFIRPSDLAIRDLIVENLEHKDPKVREAALWALAGLRSSDLEIRRAITRRLEDKNPKVRDTARMVFSQLFP